MRFRILIVLFILSIGAPLRIDAQRAGSALSPAAQANVRLVISNLRAMAEGLSEGADKKTKREIDKYVAIAANIERKLRDGSLKGLRGLQDEPPKKYSHGEDPDTGDQESPLGCYCDDITWLRDPATGEWVRCTPGDIIIDEAILDPTPGTPIDERNEEGMQLKLTLLDILVHEKGHELMEDEQLRLLEESEKMKETRRQLREVEKRLRELEEKREKREEDKDSTKDQEELDRMEEELEEMGEELDAFENELKEFEKYKRRDGQVRHRDDSDIEKARKELEKRKRKLQEDIEEMQRKARRKATGKAEHGQVYETQKGVVRLFILWFKKQIKMRAAALKEEIKGLKAQEKQRKRDAKAAGKDRKRAQRDELRGTPRDQKDAVREKHKKENEAAKKAEEEAREAHKKALKEAEERADADIERLERLIKWMKERIKILEKGMKDATSGTDFGFHRCGWPGLKKGSGTLGIYVRTTAGFWRMDLDVRGGRAVDLRLPETLFLGTLHEEEPVKRTPNRYLIIDERIYTGMQVQENPCELMKQARREKKIKIRRKPVNPKRFR